MNFVAALIVVFGLVLVHAFSGCEKADIETSMEKSPEASAALTPKDQFRRMGRAKGATPLPTEQPSKSPNE